MERASAALSARKYFETERLAVEALNTAFLAHDFERMARVLLPLQEARRQKRDLALDAGKVHVVAEELPTKIKPGCYLIVPPRVGLDGRQLRELADAAEVPVVVVVREPTTRAGLWPIVALGPVTVRTRVEPPGPDELLGSAGASAKPKAKKAAGGAKAKSTPPAPPPGAVAGPIEGLPKGVLPAPRWFAQANEALGDAGIAAVDMARTPDARVEELYLRLQAHPDHEKLHQRLMEACLEAARIGVKPAPKSRLKLTGPEFDDE